MKENLEGRMLGREQEHDKSAPDCDDLAMTWRGLSQQLSDNRIAAMHDDSGNSTTTYDEL